jgi:peptidoglycan hydrolase-like protein with peptidoglycan-binding domain
MQFTRVLLAALAALAMALVPAVPASAHGSRQAADDLLIPSAGWHGRPVKNPHQHKTVRGPTTVPRGWSAGPVSFGAGYSRPGGSDRVREVQRRLTRLGYRTGPIDGLFGPLTRASVGWFQVKHGLPVSGRATLATVRHLRASSPARSGRENAPLVGARPDKGATERATGTGAAGRPQAALTERATAPSARPDTEPAARASSPLAGIAVALLVLVLAAIAVGVRRRRTPTPSQPATTQPQGRALAYVLIPSGEHDEARFQSHAGAIETECAARGLAVVGMVVDVEDSRRIWQRPGLATAVRRLVEGEVDFLMVTKIEDATGADLKRLVEATEGEIAIARWQHESGVESRPQRELTNV